jgi:hypothetical protein
MRGGILAGVLCAEVTLFVMKGGVIDELFGWRSGRSQGGELLEFAIVIGVLGVVLGFVGAAFAATLNGLHRRRPPSNGPELKTPA